MRTVQIKAPKVAAVAAHLVALVLLQLNYDLHLVFDTSVGHFTDTEHADSSFIADFKQSKIVACAFGSKSVND